ncbi:unnamed protein product [Peronospora belbahrii]|uniref:Uncharacterized protein n=1 Tax=Peronospora belbahrii TaxID=622444 RepID=A0AAU9LC67_9STRA|nr:unnamed protein product [Peronospora belbahrii]
MPPKRKHPRSAYRSSLADNARPGGLTTMDVLLRWITVPGNVKRWRLETHSSLVREVVEIMREEGLVHRKAPFVRYKLDAIEKQYITAKQWLLETGMHDTYMRGKASKEVKAHVENVCPQFKRLDPAFRGVPFSKKNAEPIELDVDCKENDEMKKIQEEEEELSGAEGSEPEVSEVEGSDEEGVGEEGDEGGKDGKHTKKGDNSDQLVDRRAKNGRSLDQVTKPLRTKAATSTELHKRNTFRDRLLSSMTTAEKRALSPALMQKKPAKAKEQLLSLTSNAVENEEASTCFAKPQQQINKRSLRSTINTSERQKSLVPEKAKTSTLRTNQQIQCAAVELAREQAALEAVTSSPTSAEKRRRQLLKYVTAVSSAMNEAKKTAVNADTTKETPEESPVVTRKRKILEEELGAVERTQKQRETNDELMAIERKALLKRVEDEQNHRHEIYKLERSKLECELKSKQIQLLFEKASARKKLDQLGVPQEEIDRILPI